MEHDRLPSQADAVLPRPTKCGEYTHVCFVSPRAIRNFCRSAKIGFEIPTPIKGRLRHAVSPDTNVREAIDSPDARRLHQYDREYKKALTLALLLRSRMATGTARSAALGVRLAARFVSQTASLPLRTTAARAVLAAVSSARWTDRCPRRTTPTTARRGRGLGTTSKTNHSHSSGT